MRSEILKYEGAGGSAQTGHWHHDTVAAPTLLIHHPAGHNDQASLRRTEPAVAVSHRGITQRQDSRVVGIVEDKQPSSLCLQVLPQNIGRVAHSSSRLLYLGRWRTQTQSQSEQRS